jgi:hypothetical protein
MCALVDNLFSDTRYPVEDDGACAALDVVDGRLNDGGADCGGDEPAEEGGWDGGHGGGLGV